MITILDGNAFYLRITGKTKVGEYEATLDLEAIDSLIVNFVRRVRESQAVTHDGGMVLAYNDGKLAKGVYGVEMVGYYNGQPWRYYAPEVFEIADGGETEASNVIGSVNVYDVTFYMKLGGDGVTPGYVDAAVTMHNTSEEAHSDMRDAITGIRTQVERRLVGAKVTFSDGHTEDVELGFNDQGEVILLLPKETFGKIDGVKVNGEELQVDENGKVDISISATVDDGVATEETPPSVTPTMEEGSVRLDLHNLRGNGITDIEQTTTSDQDEGVNVVTIKTDTNPEGTPFEVRNGSRGNGIAYITETTSDEDGGTNVVTIHYTDPNVPDSVLYVKNGRQGRPGADKQPVEAGDVIIAHGLGGDETKVMSQEAVTNEIMVYDYIDLDDTDSLEVIDDKRLNNSQSASDAGKWTSGEGQKCVLIPVRTGMKVAFETNNATYYAFLASDGGKTVGQQVVFAEGYSATILTSSAKTYYLDVPSGAKLMYFMIKASSGGTDCTPSSFAFVQKAKDKLSSNERKYDDALTVTPTITECDYAITSAGKWGTLAANTHARIPVKEGEKYIIKAPKTRGTYYGFVNTEDVTSGADIPFISGTSLVYVPIGTEVLVTVPKGSRYLVAYNSNNARPFNIKKVDVGSNKQGETISPKLMFGILLSTTGKEFYYYNDSTSETNLKYGKMCITPRFIKVADDFSITTKYANTYIRVFFYDADFNFVGVQVFNSNAAGSQIDVHSDFSYSYVKIAVRHLIKTETNGYDEPFKMASIKLTGNFPDDWDTYNPRPSWSEYSPRPINDGYMRINVIVNATDSTCTNEETQEVQDQADYYLDYGLIALPTTYSNSGKPTRLIIYCHGSGTHFSSSSLGFNTNEHVDPEYWLENGYAVMDVDGYHINDTTAHAFVPQAMDCYVAAYKWVIEHFNICKDGVFLGGRSMGGGNTLSLLRVQCPIPIIAACANLPTSLAMSYTKTAKESLASSRGFIVPLGFEWSTGTAENPYNSDEEEVILDNWDKFITWWSITSLIIDFPTDEEWRRSFIESCGLNNTNRITLMKDLHAIAKAPLKLFGCWQDPNNTPATAAVLYKQILSNSGQIAELRMFNSYKDYSGTDYTAHYYELQDPALRTSAITKFGETLTNVPIVYVEMLQFWRRYEQD